MGVGGLVWKGGGRGGGGRGGGVGGVMVGIFPLHSGHLL